MSQKTHNWSALRTEFITGDISNVSEFARMHDIPDNTIRKHSKGWLKEQEQHRQNTHQEIEEKDIKQKVINAQKRKEHMSLVIDGALEQWRKINGKLAQLEESFEVPPSLRVLQDLRKTHAMTTKIIPDLIRVMELLDGGATSRTDTVIGGKRTKDMTEQELHDAEIELAKEILEEERIEKEKKKDAEKTKD